MIHKSISTILVSVCFVIFFLDSVTAVNELDDDWVSRLDETDEEFRMAIIISPIMRHMMNREIVLWWKFPDIRRGSDTLTLFEGQPGSNGSQILYRFNPRRKTGERKTKVRADYWEDWELGYQDRCLKYYIVWQRNDTIRKSHCLATHPNWMRRRRATLGSKRLNEIFIPGSHDSASFWKEDESRFESVLDKYVLTQDEDILSQLIYGVRYLDIRVGRHPSSDPVFWANHGYFSIYDLQTIIDDVKTFLDNTQEIVIFDVHGFPIGFGVFSARAHRQLVTFLEEQFAGYYLPKTSKGWGTSLEEIWETGKRLIISYNQRETSERYDITWQAVEHKWPNVKTMDDLWTKIDAFEMEQKPIDNSSWSREPPTSVMAQFTPEAVDVILNTLGGLRVMAEVVNINITNSYHDKWRCRANIVSMDFIKGSGIIEAAIEWNDRRPSVC